MSVSSENVRARALGEPEPTRPVHELSVALVFGPLADRVVRAVLPLRIPPPAVVLAHAALGLVAAYLVARGSFLSAAILLQAKTLLDNVDGRLARASGRVDLVGRYLDTEADFVVNAALFAALASATGAPWLAVAGFVALTLLLSVDFNLAARYADVHGLDGRAPSPSGGRLERALERAYAAVFAPQDRLVSGLSASRLARVLGRAQDPERRRAAELAYYDRFTTLVLANLGLSTQLLVLGALLVVGAPAVYLWLAVLALALLPVLQLRRERRARRALDS